MRAGSERDQCVVHRPTLDAVPGKLPMCLGCVVPNGVARTRGTRRSLQSTDRALHRFR